MALIYHLVTVALILQMCVRYAGEYFDNVAAVSTRVFEVMRLINITPYTYTALELRMVMSRKIIMLDAN